MQTGAAFSKAVGVKEHDASSSTLLSTPPSPTSNHKTSSPSKSKPLLETSSAGQRDNSSLNSRQRYQKSSPVVKFETETETERLRSAVGDAEKEESRISYWHHQQTGIKSRPIKLLKHPIEHIERKIILTYLLGFLFKLIAIISGPVIVLIAYLIVVPTLIVRRSSWFLLNLFDFRINTSDDDNNSNSYEENENEVEVGDENELNKKQNQWLYCPLTFIETYWFKEKLVNNVILVIDTKGDEFSIHRLRELIKSRILIRPAFRKFLSRVVSKGIPFYKSHYWNYLGLADDENDGDDDPEVLKEVETKEEECASVITDFSSETSNVIINLDHIVGRKTSQFNGSETRSKLVSLCDHVYLDETFKDELVNQASIQHYAHNLLQLALDLNRPLWEIRIIPAKRKQRAYLIFRCHQSLADGRSLSNILTTYLAKEFKFKQEPAKESLASSSSPENKEVSSNNKNESYEDDRNLELLKERKSFVSRIRKSSSLKSSILVGPLTVLLWVIWTFTRRKNNHLNKSLPEQESISTFNKQSRRFHMNHYDLTRFHQIKQMTRSTVSEVLLCALSGALRDYLHKFNGVSNPPNLNVSLTVDMRQNSAKAVNGKKEYSWQHNQQQSENVTELETSLPEKPRVCCTLVNVPLPTSVEGTVPRLWELRNTMDELRTSADPWVMLGLQRFLFLLLPSSWYQWIINYITLRNSSIFVSNLRGPNNVVEAWCVDLLQRAILEAQQPPVKYQTTNDDDDDDYDHDYHNKQRYQLELLEKTKSKQRKTTRLKLMHDLGSISAIYYCMQPPTSYIPISFNCITYHNKLFVTSLSRSLLVEDSKLLIKLFFAQLNQLANTIAKRKSFVTIMKMPTPVEINCQPASPVSERELIQVVEAGKGGFDLVDSDCLQRRNNLTGEEFDKVDKQTVVKVKSTPVVVGPSKDDIEANIGLSESNKRCQTCQRYVCICRRRKSLFSLDTNQRSANLLSLLNPSNIIGAMRTSKSNEEQNLSSQQQMTLECLCGQQLLEELDEEIASDGAFEERSSLGSRTPSDDGGRLQRMNAKIGCAKCRYMSARSTLSLDAPPEDSKQHHQGLQWLSKIYHNKFGDSSEQNIESSNQSINSKVCAQHKSTQVIAPQDDGFYSNAKSHSKSETDLLPAHRSKKGDKQRESKDSWFVIGRRSNRKVSMFPKSSSSFRASSTLVDSTRATTKNRNVIESSLEFINKQTRAPSKRRRSVATTTRTSSQNRLIIVKDEINAEVSLRYQLDNPILGIRSRRFSTIGGVVANNQRRASLIPFGLINNHSVPKLFRDDGEAHL